MPEVESRDTSTTTSFGADATTLPTRAEIPPPEPPKGMSPVTERFPGRTHHQGGIPSISPRLHRNSSSAKNVFGAGLGSPKYLRDRSKSLGQYPPSLVGLSGSSSSSLMVPISPYHASPSLSPITTHGRGVSMGSSMPFMPNLCLNDPNRAAAEAAIKRERARAKEKEQEEESMTADELRLVLKRERSRMTRLVADLTALKSAAVQSQAEAEVCEEGRINGLMRRLETVQHEKERIIVELEREEEMLTNTLQKKLDEVRREKALLEKQIEREQSSHHDLKTRLTSIRTTEDNSTAES